MVTSFAVEVITEPLLVSRLQGVLDMSLFDAVVIGLIICGGVILGQGAKDLCGSTKGIYERHQGR